MCRIVYGLNDIQVPQKSVELSMELAEHYVQVYGLLVTHAASHNREKNHGNGSIKRY